jgi:inner membrane protein
MASLGHIAVGAAAARGQRDRQSRRWPALLFWSALSMLPDADVIGFAFGIPYEAPWGHRGATHSFAFAAMVGVAVAAVAPWFRRPGVRTGAIAAAVVASHALLDTLTDGGLGCALFWPFDLTRYFAPWRPIPVSPIGLYFVSPQGLFVAVVELILFAPLLVWALRRSSASRLRRGLGWAAWASAVWLIGSSDPVRERVVGIVLDEDTEFASGFSESALRGMPRDATTDEVARRLGPPLEMFWYYFGAGERPCPAVHLENGVVTPRGLRDACRQQGIQAGVSSQIVRSTLGVPQGECWAYSRARGGHSFRARTVCFFGGRLEEVISRWAPSTGGQ